VHSVIEVPVGILVVSTINVAWLVSSRKVRNAF
jgi:hypothetical protein